MPADITDLDGFEIAHLHKESGVVMVRGLDELRAEALELVADGTATPAYRSVHGGVIAAHDEVVRLLDTFLEKRLPEAFTPMEERAHWEDDDPDAGPLPAGPGPYGSGLRGLGSSGERIDLTVGLDTYLPHPNPWLEEDGDGADGGDDEEDEEDDDAPHRREPWREVTGDTGLLRAWLVDRMRWTSNDGQYTDYPQTEQERIRLAETQSSRLDLAERILAAFPPHRSRYFIGAHAGWDRWSEDYLSRDEVIACVSADQVAVMRLAFYRYYG